MKPLFVDAAKAPSISQLHEQTSVPYPHSTELAVQPTTPVRAISMSDIDKVGQQTEVRVGATTKKILDGAKTNDAGEFGTKLNVLIATTKELNPKTMGKQGLLSKLVHFGGSVKERMLSEFESVTKRIETLVAELDRTATLAEQRADQCDALFEENYQTFRQLDIDKATLASMVAELNAQLASLPQVSSHG